MEMKSAELQIKVTSLKLNISWIGQQFSQIKINRRMKLKANLKLCKEIIIYRKKPKSNNLKKTTI